MLILDFFVPRVYTEEQPGDAAVMLFIKDLREEDSGQYRCKGYYASNEEMYATVQISTFSKYNLYVVCNLTETSGKINEAFYRVS